MLNLLAFALLLAAPPALPTASFEDRVTQGKLVEAGLTGPAYQKLLWANIGDPTTAALKACIAATAHADKSPFTLIADVLPDGTPNRVEVRPSTALANCLAAQFGQWKLPAPPANPAPYPIEIDVSIVP